MGGAPIDIVARPRPGRPPGVSGAPGGAFSGSFGGFVVGLPSVDRPPNATDFNLFSTLAARNIANTPAPFPGTFQVPPQNVATIKSISILANALLVTSSIIWTLRFNGNGVVGWNALTINPRAAGSVEVSWVPEETAIPVPEGSLIDTLLTVLDAGTYQVSVSIHGWFYPTALAMAAQNATP